MPIMRARSVASELLALDVSKATGPDSVPSILLKNVADVLAVPLVILDVGFHRRGGDLRVGASTT